MNKPMTRPLTAANKTKINTWGFRSHSLNLGPKEILCRFAVADVQNVILGSDFLRESGLLLDVRGQRLIDPDCPSTIVLFISTGLKFGCVSGLECFQIAENS